MYDKLPVYAKISCIFYHISPLLSTVGVEPCVCRIRNALESVLSERIVNARAGAKLLEALCSAEGHKAQIFLPRVPVVPLAQRPKFERGGLCKAVVDIVERIEIDMQLSLPAASV